MRHSHWPVPNAALSLDRSNCAFPLVNLKTNPSIKAYLKFCKITKTPSWEPYNPSNEPVDSFELDIYNDGDLFDNTNDYMDDPINFYAEGNDSEERINPENPSKQDKDSDYDQPDEGPVYGVFYGSKRLWIFTRVSWTSQTRTGGGGS